MRDWTTTTVRHGTNSGFSLHQDLGEDPCNACYTAKQVYDAQRRSAPFERVNARLHATAQGRASQRLRRLHPEEYKWFYDDEKKKLLEERADELADARKRDEEAKRG